MVEIYAPKHMNQNYYATVLTQDRTQGVCKDSLWAEVIMRISNILPAASLGYLHFFMSDEAL